MRTTLLIWVIPALAFCMLKTAIAQDSDRVALARVQSEPALRATFAAAGVLYPPQELFFRAFKREGEIEMWAMAVGGVFRKVATYPVLAASGGPGPKRREGDRQVPEGFYEIERFNPRSLFHLSLGLNYPNAADRILGHKEQPGTDIFIHGSNVSIGCLPVGDTMVEQVYLAALDTVRKPVTVHVFPARMDSPSWPEWSAGQIAASPALEGFWNQLRPAYYYFEQTRRLPAIVVDADGIYRTMAR